MSLHINWKHVVSDLAILAGLANSVYNVHESVVDKHPNAKLYVRCGHCTGILFLFISKLHEHYFTHDSKPSISGGCPHCKKDLDHHSMHYHEVTRD